MNCDAISYLCLVATRLVALENFRFSCKAQYAIRVSPDVHSNARRFFFVALRSQGRSLSVLLTFSFPDRHSAKRDGGLLLPYPRGDRPPGNVPDGILLCAGWRLRRIDVKDQIPQCPAELQRIIPKPPRPNQAQRFAKLRFEID